MILQYINHNSLHWMVFICAGMGDLLNSVAHMTSQCYFQFCILLQEAQLLINLLYRTSFRQAVFWIVCWDCRKHSWIFDLWRTPKWSLSSTSVEWPGCMLFPFHVYSDYWCLCQSSYSSPPTESKQSLSPHPLFRKYL